MMDIEYSFGAGEIQTLINRLQPGETLSASQLLAACDAEPESVLEEALEIIAQKGLVLQIQDIPRYADDTETALRLRREEQLAKSGKLLEALEESDPLRMYLEELARIPVYADMAVLVQQLPQSAEPVFNACLGRVVELACTYTGYGVLLMDLIQEGSMGLWQALESYNGGDFGSFRDCAITQALTKAVILQAHSAGMGQRLRQSVEDYRAVDERLLTELGRNPGIAEIAEALHITPAEAEMTGKMLENARTMHRVKQPEPEALPQEEDQAVEDTAYFQMRQRIGELLSALTPEDAKLLTLRYGLEGGQPLNAAQVAAKLGMTSEEVTEREAAALCKLRQQ